MEDDRTIVKGTSDGRDPVPIARLPFDASSDNNLLFTKGFIYVVSADNKQLYSVNAKRRNAVREVPLTDSSITNIRELDGKFYYLNKDTESVNYYEPATEMVYRVTSLPEDAKSMIAFSGSTELQGKPSKLLSTNKFQIHK